MLSGTEWQEGMKQGMRDRILMILLQNQNSFISGGEISSKLGVSRTAVWKIIEQLREEGFHIQSRSNKGYKLVQIPDKLMKPCCAIILNPENWAACRTS